jgi:transglutaminase-like putative cysteine protease
MKESARLGLRLAGRLLLAQALVLISIPRAVAATPRERKFEFEYKAAVKGIPGGAKSVELWIPVPHDDPFQQITDMRIDSPYRYDVHTARYGNRVLHISLIGPRQSDFTVTVRFTAVRREHVQERLQQADYSVTKERLGPDVSHWLEPDRLVPLDDTIRKWAREVVEAAGAKTDLEKARAIYDHVVATVKYDKTGQGWGRGDIYYACDARRGNCTDFHAIFIGYCRAVGIPARFAVGFPLPPERGGGAISGYHCWAEFYLKGVGWVPVDASEAAKNPQKREYFFGAHDENRVEFTRGRDLMLSPKQQGEPLNYFVYPYAEIDGKAFSGVEKGFSYRDLSPPPASKEGR